MTDSDESPDGHNPSWFLPAFLVALLLVLFSAIGGRTASSRQTGAIASVLSGAGQVAALVGDVLGLRSHHRCRPNPGSNLRQIALGMICYSSESDGVWPRDFKQLQTWSEGELVPKLFRDPRWPTDPDPFVYVRPTTEVKADQPVLLTRPTTGSKPTVMICYGDGHIGTVAGTAQWDEARRLAHSPKAMAEGIAPEDWTTVPALRARKPTGP